MITPSYAPTAQAAILPRLALDFTTAVLDPRVTVTRALNTATRINSAGVIELVNADLPRFDYDPITLACRGILVEGARTNLLLNSLIGGSNLATQSVTLAATAYTLSFYGTGTVVISGGHSATVVGGGPYPAQKTYTFTPTAGSTTFTVTGTVSFAQLEAGAFASSFIPTAGASVLRNADDVKSTGPNFTGWYNESEGALIVQTVLSRASSTGGAVSAAALNGAAGEEIRLFYRGSGSTGAAILDGSASQMDQTPSGVIPANTVLKIGVAYKLNNSVAAAQGAAAAADTACTMPTATQLQIGCSSTTQYLGGHVQKLSYYPHRITGPEMAAFTK